MHFKFEDIDFIKRRRTGRGVPFYSIHLKDGTDHAFPQEERYWAYQLVKQWIQEGNKVLPADPKPISTEKAVHPHYCFELPEDTSQTIWQYMSLPKFISILNKNALYFCRADHLIEYDKYEGSFPPDNAKLLRDKISLKDNRTVESNKALENLNNLQLFISESNKYTLYINCWFMKAHDSALMWKYYGQSTPAIAIKSTLQRLIDSFGQGKDYEIYIGAIKYIDYDKDAISINNAFYPFLHKRKHFEMEHEIRCIISDDDHCSLFPEDEPSIQMLGIKKERGVVGIFPSSDLGTLIESIYIDPFSHDWQYQEIEQMLKTYKLEKPLNKSEI